MNSDDTLIDLRAVWNVLWLGRWTVILAVLMGIALAGYLAFIRITPTYSASAVLVLETQTQKIDGIQEIVSDLPLAGPSRELVLFTEQQVFRSRYLMNNVVKHIDLTSFYEFQPQREQPNYLQYLFPNPHPKIENTPQRNSEEFAVDRLLKQVEINLIPNSFAFKITAHSIDATLAKTIANTVAQQYIQAQLTNKSHANEQATSWLKTRVAELQRDVIKAEYRVHQFNTRIELISEKELKVQEAKLKQMRARADRMGEVGNFLIDIKQPQQTDPIDRFKSTDTTRGNATDLIDVSVAPKQKTPTKKTRPSAAFEALNYKISQLNSDIQAQADDLLALEQVKREADASRNLYEFFLTRLKETTIQKGIQRPDSRMLSLATLPQFPSSPNKMLFLILGAILGLLCGVVLLFLRHASRRCFLSPMELSQFTKLPILGAMPKPTKKQKRNATPENNGPIGEAVRNLRTRLISALPSKSSTVILSTASLQNEGKSFTTLNLAHQLSAIGKKTIMIDCDFRRLTRGDFLGDEQAIGLADIIENRETLNVAINTNQGSCDKLPSGKIGANPIDIFAGQGFADVIAHLRQRYDFIILDTPPILLFSDVGVLGRLCDVALLSVGAGQTPHEQVDQSLAFLKANEIPVAGLILTNFDARKSNDHAVQRHQRRYLQSYKSL